MLILDFKRAFNWGILVVSDAGAAMPEFDGHATHDGPILASSARALVVRVRHASDRDDDAVDADGHLLPTEVRVEVSMGRGGQSTVDHVLAISSGEVLIGDAEGEAPMIVPPGSYRVAVEVDDQEFAELVRLFFERVA
ncbi:MAG: hypothetical protein ACRDRT_09615 [Pseudonocardiaceae bacterium]